MIDLEHPEIDLDNIKTQQEIEIALDIFSDEFTHYWQGCSISEHGRNAFFNYMLDLGLSNCLEALGIASKKMKTPENAFRYTIGILKNWLKHGKTSYNLIDKVGDK